MVRSGRKFHGNEDCCLQGWSYPLRILISSLFSKLLGNEEQAGTSHYPISMAICVSFLFRASRSEFILHATCTYILVIYFRGLRLNMCIQNSSLSVEFPISSYGFNVTDGPHQSQVHLP